MTALDLALSYIARGWNPVPLPYRTKKPPDESWQHRVIDAESAPRFFNGEIQNIGVMLGPTSHGLTDTDLDCAEAIAIAPYVLPETNAIFGRASKRMSHRLYCTDLAVTTETAALQLRDPKTKSMILELRIGGGGKGAQTVFPGSVHEEGEPIGWEENGEPASVDGEDLRQRVRAVAAYSLLARYWPDKGGRHEAARIIGGLLSRHGIDPARIKVIAEAIARAAGDPEWRDRRDTAKDAAVAHHNGKNTYGLNALRAMFGTDIADKVAEWLDYRGGDEQPRSDDQANKPSSPGNEQTSPLPFINMSNWDNEPVPEQEWTALNRIPRRQCVLFSGEGAAGKSTVALHLSAAHAIARDWLGTMPEPGPSIFIDAEDDELVLHRRLAAIANHYGITFADLIKGGLHLISLLGEDAVLAAPTRSGKVEPTARYKQLFEAAGDIKPSTISIASCANVFAGSEIDRPQVQQFISLMTRIAIVANGSAVLISHPSLTGINTGSGISGTTQWHNAVRARFYMKGVKPEAGEEPDNDLRELVFKKNNYGPVSETISLRWRDGLFLPIPGNPSFDKIAQEAMAEDVFLALLRRFTAANRIVSDRTSANYAPALFAQEDEAKRAMLGSKALANTMRRLFRGGKIWNEPCGKPSRPAYRIALKI